MSFCYYLADIISALENAEVDLGDFTIIRIETREDFKGKINIPKCYSPKLRGKMPQPLDKNLESYISKTLVKDYKISYTPGTVWVDRYLIPRAKLNLEISKGSILTIIRNNSTKYVSYIIGPIPEISLLTMAKYLVGESYKRTTEFIHSPAYNLTLDYFRDKRDDIIDFFKGLEEKAGTENTLGFYAPFSNSNLEIERKHITKTNPKVFYQISANTDKRFFDENLLEYLLLEMLATSLLLRIYKPQNTFGRILRTVSYLSL